MLHIVLHSALHCLFSKAWNHYYKQYANTREFPCTARYKFWISPGEYKAKGEDQIFPVLVKLLPIVKWRNVYLNPNIAAFEILLRLQSNCFKQVVHQLSVALIQSLCNSVAEMPGSTPTNFTSTTERQRWGLRQSLDTERGNEHRGGNTRVTCTCSLLVWFGKTSSPF